MRDYFLRNSWFLHRLTKKNIHLIENYFLLSLQQSRPIDMNRQGDLMAEFEELL